MCSTISNVHATLDIFLAVSWGMLQDLFIKSVPHSTFPAAWYMLQSFMLWLLADGMYLWDYHETCCSALFIVSSSVLCIVYVQLRLYLCTINIYLLLSMFECVCHHLCVLLNLSPTVDVMCVTSNIIYDNVHWSVKHITTDNKRNNIKLLLSLLSVLIYFTSSSRTFHDNAVP